MQIIVADDDRSVALTLAGFLTASGHEVAIAHDGREAYELLKTGNYRVVISDWEMPEMNGIELCRAIRSRHLSSYVYVILLTSRQGHDSLIEGLDSGADDFISKPFEPEELRVRLRAAERIISLESRDLVIFSLARLAESRDSETGAHLERIREYARLLAHGLSHSGPYQDEIDEDFVRTIYLTSPLHDIGKVGIPDAVLLKPSRLNPDEFEIMKRHAEIGAQTLDDALVAHPNAEFLKVARDIAWCHHERIDGLGYPRGLTGDEIPLAARIVSVCDVYDALTTKRQYKAAYDHQFAVREIDLGRGTAFDPAIVDCFMGLAPQFDMIRHTMGDHLGKPDATRSLVSAPVTVRV